MLALLSGDEGLATTRIIVRDAPSVLESGGLLALEVDTRRASLVAESIDNATRAFNESDVSLAETVIENDHRIDALAAELDELTITILARQQPVARDLRIVVSALRISASVVVNLPMRAAVEEAAVRVREGGAIGRSLSQSKLFPPMSVHLISSGEASGELDQMLERAANHQESEMNGLLAAMLSVLEPLLIVIMGLVVLAIVMAILLPIFQLNQLAR